MHFPQLIGHLSGAHAIITSRYYDFTLILVVMGEKR